MDQRAVRALLEHHGWSATVGGKHVVKMVKPGRRPITLPANRRRDYPRGLLAAILRQAGITGTMDEEQS